MSRCQRQRDFEAATYKFLPAGGSGDAPATAGGTPDYSLRAAFISARPREHVNQVLWLS
jgi:hypothetical protein